MMRRWKVIVRFEVDVIAENMEDAKREALDIIFINPTKTKYEIKVKEAE